MLSLEEKTLACPHCRERVHDVLLTPAEAAAQLGVKPRTLEAWRVSGAGPEYIRIGKRRPFYRLSDISRWIEAQRPWASTSAEMRAQGGVVACCGGPGSGSGFGHALFMTSTPPTSCISSALVEPKARES